jgi:hypothetical protein
MGEGEVGGGGMCEGGVREECVSARGVREECVGVRGG